MDEDNNVVKRVCEYCSFEEEIEFYYLCFDRDLDKEHMNCHMHEYCPKCESRYDIVLDNGWCDDGEEVEVYFLNYRKPE